MNKPVTVTYDAANNTWVADENPVVVTPGLTTIEWKVTLANPDQGTIAFGTEPGFPGIQFNRDWPGTPPQGDSELWSTSITDVLAQDDPPQSFHYTVNAMYQADELTPPVKKSWDPDVEEENEPPPP